MDDHDRRHALDAELHLHCLRHQSDSPETAAAAQYAQARLLTRHGLLADAVDAYRALARDFPAVRLPDGRTGAAPLEDLAVDKRFVAYLDDPFAGRPTGRVKVMEIEDHNTPQSPDLPCDPPDGVVAAVAAAICASPSTRRRYALKVASTDGGSRAVVGPAAGPGRVPSATLRPVRRLHAHLRGDDHFLVITLGPILVGVDRIERRARWVRSLLPPTCPRASRSCRSRTAGRTAASGSQTSDGLPNQRLGAARSDRPQRRHRPDPVRRGRPRYFHRRAALACAPNGADARPGSATRSISTWSSRTSGGDAFAVRAVRTADGVSTHIADAADVYNHTCARWAAASWPRRAAATTTSPLEVRYYDVQAGKDLWRGSYPPHSHVLESSVPELTAVVAPDGTVTVVDLTTCKEAAKLSLDKKDVSDPKGQNQLVRGMLLRDRTQYYVALQTLPGPKAVAVGDPAPNFIGTIKFTEVNGMIYAFDRATGSRNWATNGPIEDRVSPAGLVRGVAGAADDGPAGAASRRACRAAPGGNQIQVACTRSIDKRTGKVLYRKEQADDNNADQFYLLQVERPDGDRRSRQFHHAAASRHRVSQGSGFLKRGRGEEGKRGGEEGKRGRGEEGKRGRGEEGKRGRGEEGKRGRGEEERGRGEEGKRGRGEEGKRGRGEEGKRGRGEEGKRGRRGRGEEGERGEEGKRGRGRGEEGKRGRGEEGKRGRGEEGKRGKAWGRESNRTVILRCIAWRSTRRCNSSD